MIPECLTTTEAQCLLDLGHAHLDGPECLTTRRAVYRWQPETQRYTRDDVPPGVQAAPPPVATSPYPSSWGWKRRRRRPMSRVEGVLYRFSLLLQWVGVGLVVWFGLTTFHHIAALWSSIKSHCAAGDAVCQQVSDALLKQAILEALPTAFWVGLWLAGIGMVLHALTGPRSLIAHWLWARPKEHP
jgi:hypothetical protein